MDDTKEREEALRSIADMIARSEKVQVKFAPGTSQHTLQKNRIHALRVAEALVKQQPADCASAGAYTTEELARAQAPLDSLVSKSEKARQKLAPGSWQHNMLSDNLKALHLAGSLLAKALEARPDVKNDRLE